MAGQAADPDWLSSAAHAAAQRLQDAANLTIAIRAARPRSRAADLPVMRAGHVIRSACDDLDQLILGHQRARTMPQVPDYAIAPRLAGIDPDPFSIWCEEFAGDLPGGYRGPPLPGSRRGAAPGQ